MKIKLNFLSKLLLIIVSLFSISCDNEEARIKRQVELKMKENDEKVKTYSSKQHLEEAKRLLQTDLDFYYARKHLQAISEKDAEYPEAQKLIEEIKVREAKQAQIRKENPPQPIQQTSNVEDSLEFKLASLNKGSAVDKDDLTVKRFRYLLESIEGKTQNTRQQIADMTFNSQQILKEKYGKEIKLLELMEQANKSMPENSNHSLKYEEVISMVVVLLGK